MKNIAKKLISFKSDKNHAREIDRCFDYVIDTLRKKGLKLKTYSQNGKGSLVAAQKMKKHYQFILSGHLDVVPASYPKAFRPYEKNGRLFGRGASDMKGPVAAMIEIMKKITPKNDVALMLTTDEEIGGFDGTRYLIQKMGYHANCAIIPDGGDCFKLTLGEKGVLHLKITTSGKTAHGSRPWEGKNAVLELIEIWNKIRKNFPPCSGSDNWKPTVNLGQINGGDATNKVPDSAEMRLDIRYPNQGDKKKILKSVKNCLKTVSGAKAEIIVRGNPLVNDPQNIYLKKIKQVAKRYNCPLRGSKNHGASDGRFFSVLGIPVIMFKPTCSAPHIDNEWIDLKSLEEWRKIIEEFISSFS